jgi:sulfur-oxidizing protein SoxY
MIISMTRRRASAIGVGALAAAWGLTADRADAANDADDLVRQFTGNRSAQLGRIMLDLPEIAENGNTVPIAVKIDSPMTEQSYVKDVLIVAEGNPRGGVVTFRFTPLSGSAEVNTRIRLAESQNVVAIARMNDGSLYKASKHVKVTIGGCGG